jgi:hypothetical protein
MTLVRWNKITGMNRPENDTAYYTIFECNFNSPNPDLSLGIMASENKIAENENSAEVEIANLTIKNGQTADKRWLGSFGKQTAY